VSTLEPKQPRRDDLLALLAELAPQIRAEPGCLSYSVHAERGDDHGRLLVIQTFASPEAFAAHSSVVAVQIPRLSALLETPPAPPTMFGPVPSGGNPAIESLSA
jgi:quinol monooxygenase YgiN